MPGSRRSVTMTSKANSASRAERGFARLGLLDRKAPVGQLLGDGLPEGALVLDEEQMFR